MSKIQEIFNRIQETKSEQKEIKTMYKNALNNSHKYGEIVEELKVLKESKKLIEDNIKEDFFNEFNKLENLNCDLTNDNQLMSDIVVTKLSKGESIKVKDEYDNEQEPVFSVKFKKS